MFVTAYGEKKRVFVDLGDEKSLTKQSFKDACDINCIVKRAQRSGGIMPPEQPLVFGDATAPDYVSMMQVLAAGSSAFEALPAKIRKEFDNDPAIFMDFVNDPANAERMVELGLAKPREKPQEVVQKVQVVNPEVPPAEPGAAG